MHCDWPHLCKEEGTVNLRLLNYCPPHAKQASDNYETLATQSQKSAREKMRNTKQHAAWLKENKKQNLAEPYKEKLPSRKTADSIHQWAEQHPERTNAMG